MKSEIDVVEVDNEIPEDWEKWIGKLNPARKIVDEIRAIERKDQLIKKSQSAATD